MRQNEFEGMCELAGEGRLTWVENTHTHMAGRVVACNADNIEVEVAGHRENWDRHDCKELTHGYKVDYTEVKRHPHEYDSHLD